MGVYLPIVLKYGLPALMKVGSLLAREIERRQIEAETGKRIQHAFYSEHDRLVAMSKEELLRQ